MSKNLINNRMRWIDISKGICILSIILGHFGNTSVNKVVFSFHLTVFFILSGYTLKLNKINAEYINKKFNRLMYPYFITCFFVLIMQIVNSIFIKHDASIITITGTISSQIGQFFFASGSISNFLDINWGGRIGAIWFLPALFFALIIVQFILNNSYSDKKKTVIAIFISLISYIIGNFVWLPFSFLSAMFAVPFILFGFYLRKYNLLSYINIKYIICFIFVFILGYIGNKTIISFVKANAQDLIFSVIIGLMTSLIVIYISKKIGTNRILEFYGRKSLLFLCVHLLELNTFYPWYKKLISIDFIYENTYCFFTFKILIITLLVFIITWIQEKLLSQKYINFANSVSCHETVKRDLNIDFCKGVLILLMLIGHWEIDTNLRNLIYSFHMLAFVIISGYFFNSSRVKSIKCEIVKLCKSFLIPYILFAFIYLIIHHHSIQESITNVLFGMSFSEKVFSSISTIGPVYFILFLFLIRVIYVNIIYFIKNKTYQNIIIVLLAALGMILGKNGYWLPWSLDCACVGVIFYHIGYQIKETNFFKYCLTHRISYFIMSLLWAFYVYSGSMELAIRDYNNLMIMIVGIISATYLIYMLSAFFNTLNDYNPLIFFQKIMIIIGKSTMYILIIHTLFKLYVNSFVASFYDLEYIYAMILSIFIQVILGVLLFLLLDNLKKSIQQENVLK